MIMTTTKLAIAATVGSMLIASGAPAEQTPLKMTLFGQPSVNNDSIWMALQNGSR
jgi:NitT/TauT family transport system substrate-binding protein